MKKISVAILTLVCVICLCACGKTLALNDIVPAGLTTNVNEIIYYGFDESVLHVSDAVKIREVIDILEDTQYVPLDEADYVEGFYSFEFVTEGEQVAVGLGKGIIGFCGKQYKTSNDILGPVMMILEIEH